MSCKIKWGVTLCWWGGYHHEEGVTTMKRTMKRRRGLSFAGHPPPWGYHLLSYKRSPSSPSSHTAPLPRCTEGVEESTTSRTCDRVRGRRWLWRRVHDLVIVKWTTTSTTSSEGLRRLRASSSTLHRQRLCGNVIPASGHQGLVSVATIS
jgi:hypothetical protein